MIFSQAQNRYQREIFVFKNYERFSSGESRRKSDYSVIEKWRKTKLQRRKFRINSQKEAVGTKLYIVSRSEAEEIDKILLDKVKLESTLNPASRIIGHTVRSQLTRHTFQSDVRGKEIRTSSERKAINAAPKVCRYFGCISLTVYFSSSAFQAFSWAWNALFRKCAREREQRTLSQLSPAIETSKKSKHFAMHFYFLYYMKSRALSSEYYIKVVPRATSSKLQ